MNDCNGQVICDFSNFVANEVEIEATDDLSSGTNEHFDKLKVAIPFFEAADHLNGALYDESNYCWSQTFTEIGQQPIGNFYFYFQCNQFVQRILFDIAEIHIRLTANVTPKNLKVTITNTSIDVYSHSNDVRQDILCGKFPEKCKAQDAVWTITEGNKLNICLGWFNRMFDFKSLF